MACREFRSNHLTKNYGNEEVAFYMNSSQFEKDILAQKLLQYEQWNMF